MVVRGQPRGCAGRLFPAGEQRREGPFELLAHQEVPLPRTLRHPPAAPGDPIAFAASLLGVTPPPEIAFEDARKSMTPFAVSFYGESKRVRNDRIKSALGVTLRYPTYREGLRALAGEGPASGSAQN